MVPDWYGTFDHVHDNIHNHDYKHSQISSTTPE